VEERGRGREKGNIGRMERSGSAERRKTENRRNKEKRRQRVRQAERDERGGKPRFPLVIETATGAGRERRKEGRRAEERVGVPKMAPR